MRCWGCGGHGALGTGSAASSPTPVVTTASAGAAPLSGISGIAAARYHTCARFESGSVRCWGYNGWGQIDDGTTMTRLSPTAVSLRAAALDVDTGGDHSCVLLADASVRCWGSNYSGQLGEGTIVSSRPFPALTDVF